MAANDDKAMGEIALRLASIEGLLHELLRRRRSARQKGRKLSQSLAERARSMAENDNVHKPTELDMARARRAIRRSSR